MLSVNKSKWLKIVIPVVIVCVIGGVWLLKNAQGSETEQEAPVSSNNQDFALHVTDELDLDQLKSYGLPIIIDFGADSCVPCKEMAPVLKTLNEEYQGKVIIKFVDVWKYQELAQGFPISLIPTQIFIGADGKTFNPENPTEFSLNQYVTKDTSELVFTTHEGGMTKEDFLKIFKVMGVQ
ncbi:thioredoxin family protein [Acetobacterium sp.]|uniref:thioredoxin family protein n=1 Tax=Acetobacterium sp. TaxID=1872094 RepID=UPI00359385F7